MAKSRKRFALGSVTAADPAAPSQNQAAVAAEQPAKPEPVAAVQTAVVEKIPAPVNDKKQERRRSRDKIKAEAKVAHEARQEEQRRWEKIKDEAKVAHEARVTDQRQQLAKQTVEVLDAAPAAPAPDPQLEEMRKLQEQMAETRRQLEAEREALAAEKQAIEARQSAVVPDQPKAVPARPSMWRRLRGSVRKRRKAVLSFGPIRDGHAVGHKAAQKTMTAFVRLPAYLLTAMIACLAFLDVIGLAMMESSIGLLVASAALVGSLAIDEPALVGFSLGLVLCWFAFKPIKYLFSRLAGQSRSESTPE